MPKRVITVPNVPKYPFSPAIQAGDYIFVSGQPGSRDPITGNAIEGIGAQMRRSIENIKQILETAGASLNDVVKVTVFLADASDFAIMNELYESYFPVDHPARSTVIVGLPLPDMLIEIECVAYCPSK